MRKKSKVAFALAFLLVVLPFLDYGIAQFLLRDVPDAPVLVVTPVTYGIYFPKTYAIIEAERNGEILWKASYTLHVRTEGNLSLPVVYDHRPKIQELIHNRSMEMERILEEIKENKGNWNGSELYLKLSNVIWLNESIAESREGLNEATVELFPVAGQGWTLLQALVITLAGIAFAFEIKDFADRKPTTAFVVAVIFAFLLFAGYTFVFTGYPFHARHSSIPDGFLAGVQPVERKSTVSPPCLEDWYVGATPEVEKTFLEHLRDNPPVRAEDPEYYVHDLELWLNESERDALFSELESLCVVWVWNRECQDQERLRHLDEVEKLGLELLDRGYIDERDFHDLEAFIDAERKRVMEMKFPARYRIWVHFTGR